MELQRQSSTEVSSIYRRQLPGGGYVAIDIERDLAPSSARTRVSVERDAQTSLERLVIAEAEGDERSPAFGDMYHIAADNAAIARALLKLSAVSRAD
jgi:hypothetical protein